MVREETWEAFVADSFLYAKVCDYDLCDYDLCETLLIQSVSLWMQQIFLIGVSLVMDYRVAIWFCVIFSGGVFVGLQLINTIKNKSFFEFLLYIWEMQI